MLGQLDLLILYPIFNVLIAVSGIMMIAHLNQKNVKSIQIYLAVFFGLSVPCLIWYAAGYHSELCLSLVILLTHLPLTYINGPITTQGGLSYYMNPSEWVRGGGGGRGRGGGGSASASASGSGSTQPAAPTNNIRHAHTPEEIEEALNNISASDLRFLEEFYGDPSDLLMHLRNFSVLSKVSITEEFQSVLSNRAAVSTPKAQPVPHNIPEGARNYWLYKMAYCNIKYELKILDLLREHRVPIIKRDLDRYTQLHKTSESVVFNILRRDFPLLNHAQRRFITRNMQDPITKDSVSDSE